MVNPWTIPSNITNMAGLATELNTATNGGVGILLLVAVLLVSFFSLKVNYDTERALITSLFFAFVVSLFLINLGLLAWGIAATLGVLVGVSMLWLHFHQSGGI